LTKTCFVLLSFHRIGSFDMTQVAYLIEQNDAEPSKGVERDFAITVSLFSDNENALGLLAEDALSAGLQIASQRNLVGVLDGAGAILGEIVLVDCGEIDAERLAALSWLDERAARCGSEMIVSTTTDALEDVFGCLDQSGGQILAAASRPERLIALGSALARAPGHKLREMDEGDRKALLRLTEEVGRIARKLDTVPTHLPTADTSMQFAPQTSSAGSPTQGFRNNEREQKMERKPRPPLPDPRLVKSIIRERQKRSEFFEGELFADPAWDILLDLTAARAEHRRVSVTSLCIAANVPATTALRWIAQMVDTGILERIRDDTDRRRAFIALSNNAADAMARYFDAIGQSGAQNAQNLSGPGQSGASQSGVGQSGTGQSALDQVGAGEVRDRNSGNRDDGYHSI
jgi:hypothetical protein